MKKIKVKAEIEVEIEVMEFEKLIKSKTMKQIGEDIVYSIGYKIHNLDDLYQGELIDEQNLNHWDEIGLETSEVKIIKIEAEEVLKKNL